MPLRRPLALWALVTAVSALLAASVDAGAAIPTEVRAAGPSCGPGTLVRTTLKADELAAPHRARFVLKLRHFSELRDRIEQGETVSIAEMQARYFPTPEAWKTVAAWANAHGYTVEDEDATHLTVFARAAVAQVQKTLQVHFSRILAADGQEFTASGDMPVVPAELADAVAGVTGLSAPLQTRPSQAATSADTASMDSGGYLTPQALAQLYHATGLGLDGTGQTIVILGADRVNPSDLATFWSRYGLPTTVDQFTEIDPDGLPGSSLAEETCDIEWASAMAPKAHILYISTVDIAEASALLLKRIAADPTIHQLSVSFALSEAPYAQMGVDPAQSQYYAALAAVGVTNFASSGDYGSSTDYSNGMQGATGAYDPNGIQAPAYPATDPFVTAVGGTTVGSAPTGTGTNGSALTEGGWTLPDPAIASGSATANFGGTCSTGGTSLFFARPSWQKGAGLPTGAMRCVPDVAARAAGSPPVYAYYSNQGSVSTSFGGTSLSAPIWAGLCALLNQARANAGLAPLGLLGPHIYPLMGTSAFNAITTGSATGNTFTTTANNGAYGVGPDYNLVTGLGSPNLANLVAALAPAAPQLTSQPVAQSVAAGGTVTLQVAASGTGLSYQWQCNGENIPANLPTLTLTNIGTTQAGDYRVVVTGPNGSVTSKAATVTVAVDARLIGLSSRAFVGPGAQALVAGFVVQGPGPKRLLVRGIGPTLGEFSVAGVLAAPQLTVFDASSAVIATNAGWGTAPTAGSSTAGATVLPATTADFAQTYAFPLPDGSADCAAIATLPAAAYTAQVSGTGNTTGIALAELYDADRGPSAARLSNISARALAGPGAQALVAGFTISGTSSETVLIRGVGPGLSQFGLTGVLARPTLTLYDCFGNAIALNTGWDTGGVEAGDSAISAQVQSVTGALTNRISPFALATGSADCALVATLPPGNYTAQVSGVDGTTGVALVEIYDVP